MRCRKKGNFIEDIDKTIFLLKLYKKEFLIEEKIIMDIKPIELRKRFHKAFNLPLHDKPTNITYSRSVLHRCMLKEELDEYEQASIDKNLVEVADALIDMQEVLFGMFAEHGMLDKWYELYLEVHKSNMSKLDNNGEPILNGEKGHFNQNKPLGKVLKSTNFIEPDFERILNI